MHLFSEQRVVEAPEIGKKNSHIEICHRFSFRARSVVLRTSLLRLNCATMKRVFLLLLLVATGECFESANRGFGSDVQWARSSSWRVGERKQRRPTNMPADEWCPAEAPRAESLLQLSRSTRLE